MNHKISSIVLILCIFIFGSFFALGYLTSEEIQEGFNCPNNSILFFSETSQEWGCANLFDQGILNVSVNNVTNIFTNYSLYANQSSYLIDGENTYVPYTGATADVDLGAFRLDTTGTISGGLINAVTGLYQTLRVDGKLTLAGGGAWITSDSYANFTGVVRSLNDVCVVGTGCLTDIYNFWELGGETPEEVTTNNSIKIFNNLQAGNITALDNITADFYKGDGSLLTGLPEGMWNNDSNTAQFEGNVNITGNLSVGTLELNSDESKSPLSYFGTSTGSDSPSVAQFYINTTLNPAYPFDFKAYVDTSASGNAGVLIQRGQIGTYQNGNTQLIEGIRFIIEEESATQTTGVRTVKGINNEFKDPTITGGTNTAYGLYNDFNGRAYTGGSGTIGQYGVYVTQGQDTSFAGTTTKNEYGVFIQSIADFFIAGTGNRYGMYLDGFDKGANEQGAWGIWVDDGLSRFDDVNITTDLYADSNTLSSCGWEGDASLGAICGNNKIQAGFNSSNNELYCCEL